MLKTAQNLYVNIFFFHWFAHFFPFVLLLFLHIYSILLFTCNTFPVKALCFGIYDIAVYVSRIMHIPPENKTFVTASKLHFTLKCH